eukprot:CAMPEP_0174339730 /NCGR_PEP_ID=MMETSP0810-20121108/24140_1 /TAXON_ID=73025 ORGANISM="Eutreptiella gymnastica-like, Strain CCMP1594" /NCGR_SAMPLE_ID=MMETSP0810 /ASSEMBLY_ACC=CAM_ASM_000659 /LENGTH=113 /DNA_ID=CAMNT_0015460531 /DNA_START=464 /DNA_END=805 /DNA_ORIENTATION=+
MKPDIRHQDELHHLIQSHVVLVLLLCQELPQLPGLRIGLSLSKFKIMVTIFRLHIPSIRVHLQQRLHSISHALGLTYVLAAQQCSSGATLERVLDQMHAQASRGAHAPRLQGG